MNMETPKSISLADVLLLIAIAISILLPVSFVPIGLMVAGGGYLLFAVVRAVRSRILPRAAFGPASAATFIFVFGICLLVRPGQLIFTLILTIVITLILQMAWVILRNRFQGR
jgi:hypothetical protein